MGLTREHRAAMLSNMSVSLITHGRIKTTLAKAKALRPFVEKVVTKAKKAAAKTEKKDKLHLRRLALRDVRDEAAISLLFDEKVSEFENRPGGYTRIYKLGQRVGDAAEMALIEFVKADDPGYKKPKKKGKAKKAAATSAEATADKAAPPAVEAAGEATTAEPAAEVEATAAGATEETKVEAVAEAAPASEEAPKAEAAEESTAAAEDKPAAAGESSEEKKA